MRVDVRFTSRGHARGERRGGVRRHTGALRDSVTKIRRRRCHVRKHERSAPSRRRVSDLARGSTGAGSAADGRAVHERVLGAGVVHGGRRAARRARHARETLARAKAGWGR